MGPHHNLVLSLERSGSSFTSAASVLTSFSLLLLGYLQPMSNSVGQVAASIAPQPLGNAHIPILIQENVGCSTKPSLNLSLHFSHSYSSSAQTGTGDRSGVSPKQMCGHL